MKFISWRDYYIFLRDYVNYSCLNCQYGGNNLNIDEEHSDIDYATVFCKFNISMVRFDFQTLCIEWEDNEGHTLPVEDGWNYKFSEKVLEVFESDDSKGWTIEDIREVIENHEEVKE